MTRTSSCGWKLSKPSAALNGIGDGSIEVVGCDVEVHHHQLLVGS
jgi:hypothetical protein